MGEMMINVNASWRSSMISPTDKNLGRGFILKVVHIAMITVFVNNHDQEQFHGTTILNGV